ncbi:hypothetical protein ILP97_60960 [Amycolatopsis sp. H6(2020)]|nr:hypothetical protein [Amycolatopsis sp. H6(2020)]
MRFRASDVVVSLALNVETEEFATAAGVGASVAGELGASAIEIQRADPEGGRKGFIVDLLTSVPVIEGEPVGDALRRAVSPAAAKYRVDLGGLEFRGDLAAVGYAELPLWQEVQWNGYIVFSLSAEPGGRQELRRSVFVTRPDFTPRADSDLVIRVHLRVPVADPVRALDLCGPEIAATDASFVQIVSAQAAGSAEEYCEVALLSAVPALDGEDAEAGLRRVTEALAARLGLAGGSPEVRDGMAVLAFEPDGRVESVAVRVQDDPLYED